MKPTNIFLAFLCLFFSSLLHAEENKDYNTDVFYLFSNEGFPIPLESEGDWTISFGNIDTLGNVYDYPVIINYLRGESLNASVAMQNVDSIQMFEPSPVVRDGVFDLSEEYYPFILKADTAQIVFDASVAQELSMPFLGDRIVSHVFREPIKAGLQGIITGIHTEGDQLTIVFLPEWNSMNKYYETFAHVYYLQDFLPSEECPRFSPRRGNENEEDPTLDEHFILWPDDNFDGKKEKKKQLLDGKYGEFEVAGFFQVAPEVFCDIKFNAFLKKNTQWKGAHLRIGAKADIDGEVSATGKVHIPIPSLGAAKNTKFCDVSVGLTFCAELIGKLTFDVRDLDYSMELSLIRKYENDEPISDWEFDMQEYRNKPVVTWDATVELNVSLDIGFEAKFHDVPFELVDGKIGAALSLPYIHIKRVVAGGSTSQSRPYDLERLWERIEKNNEYGIGLKGSLTCEELSIYEHEVPEKYQKYSSTVYIWQFKVPRVDLVNSSVRFKRTDDVELDSTHKKATCKLYQRPYSDNWWNGSLQESEFAFIRSNMDMEHQLWAWNLQTEHFDVKQPIGRFGKFSGNLDGNEFDLLLRKGYKYEIYPVLASGVEITEEDIASGLHGSEGPLQEIQVPYDVETLEPDIDDITVTGNGKFDEEAVKDNKSGELQGKIVWGFEYNEVGIDLNSNPIDVPCGQLLDKKGSAQLTGKEFERNKEYHYRAYLRVDNGPKNYGDIVNFKIEEEPLYPKTNPATKIDYEEATLNGYLYKKCLEEYQEKGLKSESFKLGFTYGEGVLPFSNTVYVTKSFPDRDFSYKVDDLDPATTYRYYAFITRDGVTYPESITDREYRVFTTKDPYKCKTEDNIADYFSAQVFGSYDEWIRERLLEETDQINLFDKIKCYFRWGKTEKEIDDRINEPVYSGTAAETILAEKVMAEITGLEANTDYYYQFFVEFTNSKERITKRNHTFHGKKEKLHTEDPYSCKTLGNEPDSYSAIVYGEYAKYLCDIQDEEGNDLKVYFQWGETEADILNGVNENVPVLSTETPSVETEITGLQPLTKYYYRVCVEFMHDGMMAPLIIGEIKDFTTTDPFWVITTEKTHLEHDRYSVVLNGKMSDHMRKKFNTNEVAVNAGFEYSFESNIWNTGIGQLYTSVADIDKESGCFSFNTDYTQNDFMIGLGEWMYYRAFADYNSDRYYGEVLSARFPDIFHVYPDEYCDFEESVEVYAHVPEQIVYLDSIYYRGGLLGTDSINYHVVDVYIVYSLDKDDLDEEDLESQKVQKAVCDFKRNWKGYLTPDMWTEIFDMEYNSTYYYRAVLKVDNLTVWSDEIKSLETLEWDPDHGVDAPRRRPTHGQQSRKLNLSQVSE